MLLCYDSAAQHEEKRKVRARKSWTMDLMAVEADEDGEGRDRTWEVETDIYVQSLVSSAIALSDHNCMDEPTCWVVIASSDREKL